MKGFGATQRVVLDHIEAFTAVSGAYQPTTQEIAQRCGLTVESAKGALKRLRALGVVGATQRSGRQPARWTLLPVVEDRIAA